MYPTLPKSYKDLFPFKIATTSFIYPHNYVQNVKMLAPYLDEIELLLYESSPESLPSKDEIKQLYLLGKDFGITYNVHLPIDIFLGDPDPSKCYYAIETVKRVVDLTASLSPSSNTLHLVYNGDTFENKLLKKWQEIVYRSMEQLIGAGIKGENISIETLMYPLEWVDKIIAAFNLSVCIDIGHLILQEADFESIFNQYSQITPIIHLHGVEKNCAHISLDRISEKNIKPIMRILKRFTGVVSLEVFSYHHLKASLNFLEKFWEA